MLSKTARRLLPASVRQSLRRAYFRSIDRKNARALRRMEQVCRNLQPGSVVDCFGYSFKINDGPGYFVQYKDLFIQRLYHFESQTTAPYIIDCGSNIGMSMLYFKSVYPQARILGFEPDPNVYTYLDENIRQNRIEGVDIVRAACGTSDGTFSFFSDSKCGSYLADLNPVVEDLTFQKMEVPCVRLKKYLTEPVDFLKMNIEGAECDVLTDCGDSLRMVRQMIIEYHHLPGLRRNLHTILALLNDLGFEYLINDFDSKTNPGVLPPFRLMPQSRYFLLLFASKKE